MKRREAQLFFFKLSLFVGMQKFPSEDAIVGKMKVFLRGILKM